MNPYKITAQQLKTFNETAFEEKQNRVLNIQDKYSKPEQCPQKLDMTKLCVLTPLMFHTNHSGVEAWRCHICYGVLGQEEPIQALLDVPLCFEKEMKQSPIQRPIKVESLTG